MKIVFFGTPHYVVPILEKLFHEFEVVGIVTAPDHWVQKTKKLVPSAVKSQFQHLSEESPTKKTYPLNIFTPENFDQNTIKNIALLKPDLFIIAAYGKLLPQPLLGIPLHGTLCVHPSLLPTYRGPAPIPFTILSGENTTGTVIIKIDEKMDHGPVLQVETYPVHETDTYDSLMNHLFRLGANMLPQTINDYVSGKIIPQPQDDEKATFTKLITKDDGYFDLENPPSKEQLDRMTRAYHPWPGVWTTVRIKNQESRIKFLPFGMIQVEGKKPIPYKDFFNGYPQLRPKLEPLFK